MRIGNTRDPETKMATSLNANDPPLPEGTQSGLQVGFSERVLRSPIRFQEALINIVWTIADLFGTLRLLGKHWDGFDADVCTLLRTPCTGKSHQSAPCSTASRGPGPEEAHRPDRPEFSSPQAAAPFRRSYLLRRRVGRLRGRKPWILIARFSALSEEALEAKLKEKLKNLERCPEPARAKGRSSSEDPRCICSQAHHDAKATLSCRDLPDRLLVRSKTDQTKFHLPRSTAASARLQGKGWSLG